MNFLVILAITILVCIGWFVSLRFLGLKSQIQQRDPASAQQRLDWIRALRDLTFFFVLYFVISTLLLFVGALLVTLIDPPNRGNFLDSFGQSINSVSQENGVLSVGSIWGALIAVAGALLAVLISQRVARGRFIKELGLRYYKALPLDIVFGLLLGPIVFAIVFFFERTTGLLLTSSDPTFDIGQIALWGAIFICVAVSEELIVRGYILQTINSTWGGAAAIVASSVFWGVAHLLNPYSSIVSATNIAFAGLIFAYAYWITGNLWLPIAFHFSWNFAEGVLFGYPVSGISVQTPVLQTLVEGPSAITGGQFGPEGGFAGLLATLLGGLLLFGWSKTRLPTPKK